MTTAPLFPEILTPGDRRAPVVVSVPHSGTLIPESEHEYYNVAPDELIGQGDLFVDRLYDGVDRFGATVIRTPYNRFLVDLNRLEDDLSPMSVEGGRVRRDPGYYGHRGLFWAVTSDGSPIYRRPMSRADARHRVETYYRPYHEALSRVLDELVSEFGFAVLLDAHSMPSHSTSLSTARRIARPDVVPGNLYGASCNKWLTTAVTSYWKSCGRTVSLNRPYRGGGITRQHASPSRGIHAIQIELNRAMYMDEDSLKPNAGFTRLQAECSGFVARICRARPSTRFSSAAE